MRPDFPISRCVRDAWEFFISAVLQQNIRDADNNRHCDNGKERGNNHGFHGVWIVLVVELRIYRHIASHRAGSGNQQGHLQIVPGSGQQEQYRQGSRRTVGAIRV